MSVNEKACESYVVFYCYYNICLSLKKVSVKGIAQGFKSCG